jgi:hypothetical protein
MRRTLLVVLAAVATVAAVLLLVLAADVRRWERTFASGDVAFHSAPTAGRLWTPSEILPGDPARRLLGVEDDLAYRRAVRYFRLGRPRAGFLFDPRMVAQRTTAQGELTKAIVRDRYSNPRRAGAAANLLGALALSAASTPDQQQRLNALRVAVGTLQVALQLDPENENAKFNLEVALRRLKAQPKPRNSTDPSQNTAPGAGTLLPGSGY